MFRRELRPEARPPTLRFRGPHLHIPLWLLAVGWGAVLWWRGLVWLARHPRSTVVLVLAGALVWTDTVLPASVVLGFAVCAAAGWWAVEPDTFGRHVLEPAQRQARQWLTYRRNWQPAMLTAGLSLREAWGGDLPQLRRVSGDGGVDVLRVRMLPGQTLDQWRAAAAPLASTFGARQVRVRRVPSRARDVDLLVTWRARSSSKGITTVTKPQPEAEPEQAPAGRGAFPRAPRGASS